MISEKRYPHDQNLTILFFKFFSESLKRPIAIRDISLINDLPQIRIRYS
jgi:hypothetical protein